MRKVIGVVLGVCVALTLAAVPAQARTPRPVQCFKWNGRLICLVIDPQPTPRHLSVGHTVIHDGTGWLV